MEKVQSLFARSSSFPVSRREFQKELNKEGDKQRIECLDVHRPLGKKAKRRRMGK